MITIEPNIKIDQTTILRVPKIHRWRLVWGYWERRKTYIIDDPVDISLDEFYEAKVKDIHLTIRILDSTPGKIQLRAEVDVSGIPVLTHMITLVSLPESFKIDWEDRKMGLKVSGEVRVQSSN